MTALAVVAVGVGVYAILEQRLAEQHATEAEQQGNEANRQRAEALSNESRALVALSSAELQRGHVNGAVKLALAAWPRSEGDPGRPRLEATLVSISDALVAGRLYTREFRHDAPV